MCLMVSVIWHLCIKFPFILYIPPHHFHNCMNSSPVSIASPNCEFPALSYSSEYLNALTNTVPHTPINMFRKNSWQVTKYLKCASMHLLEVYTVIIYVIFTHSLKMYQIAWGSISWKFYSILLSYQFQFIIVWKLPSSSSYAGYPLNVCVLTLN